MGAIAGHELEGGNGPLKPNALKIFITALTKETLSDDPLERGDMAELFDRNLLSLFIYGKLVLLKRPHRL